MTDRKQEVKVLLQVVDEQINTPELWDTTGTPLEARLQLELHRLHLEIGDISGVPIIDNRPCRHGIIVGECPQCELIDEGTP